MGGHAGRLTTFTTVAPCCPQKPSVLPCMAVAQDCAHAPTGQHTAGASLAAPLCAAVQAICVPNTQPAASPGSRAGLLWAACWWWRRCSAAAPSCAPMRQRTAGGSHAAARSTPCPLPRGAHLIPPFVHRRRSQEHPMTRAHLQPRRPQHHDQPFHGGMCHAPPRRGHAPSRLHAERWHPSRSGGRPPFVTGVTACRRSGAMRSA